MAQEYGFPVSANATTEMAYLAAAPAISPLQIVYKRTATRDYLKLFRRHAFLPHLEHLV